MFRNMYPMLWRTGWEQAFGERVEQQKIGCNVRKWISGNEEG